MATCLLALGSNLGDRQAQLDSAIHALGGLPDVTLVRHSHWYATLPVGAADGGGEFLNGAAHVRTSRIPDDLLRALVQIENDHGRQRSTRWGPRTLDLDLLLYDQRVIDTPSLTVPHPRMSFRRFVLVPAAEIAAQMMHPTTGWTLEELLARLDTAADRVAILSPSAPLRRDLAAALAERLRLEIAHPSPAAGAADLWPAELTTWLQVPSDVVNQDTAKSGHPRTESGPTSPVTIAPKLSIILPPPPSQAAAVDSAWRTVAERLGRGPTLQVPASEFNVVLAEAMAAVQTVWPGLGP